ncbi:hypothetical protein EOM60_04095 [Candidatus Saccharibacteria bacterium]|nr:hypothetical protein [Candidatus Saccharibacteria bacterium]
MSHRKLVIAIDCDDMLFLGAESMVNIYNRLYGTSVSLSRAYESNNQEWQASDEEKFRRLSEIQLSDEYNQLDPIDGSVGAVHQLAGKHELHLVTARPVQVSQATSRLIERFFPGYFSEIHHVGSGSKGLICSSLRADLLIDDNYKHLIDANNHGISNLSWFGDYPWQMNKPSELGALDQIVRCRIWQDVVYEVERIEQN